MAKHRINVPNPNKKDKVSFAGDYPTEQGFKVLFDRYSAKYKATQGKLGAGESMYIAKKGFEGFKQLYLAEYNQAVKDNVVKGKTPAETANWIVNKIVEKERFAHSKEQAKAYQKGFEFFNQTIELHAIRAGRHEAEINVLEDDLETINNAIKNKDEKTLLKYFKEEEIADIKRRWDDYASKDKEKKSGVLRANFIGQTIFGS